MRCEFPRHPTSPSVAITDISVGIPWGPRAFPITRHAVYFGMGMRHLTERWVRRIPSDATVILLVEDLAMPEAQELTSKFRQIKGILTVPHEVTEGNYNPIFSSQCTVLNNIDAIVLPVPVEHKSIEFIPGNNMPNLFDQYPLFRGLWRAGFRQFALHSFSGFRQVEIPQLLDAFEDIHKGRRCFIVGNGPSLNQLNMTRLREELTFGSNRCFMGFQKWGFHFNYWSCVDRLQVEEYGLEYQDNLPKEIVKFIPFEYLPLLQLPNSCPVNFDYEWRPPHRFSGSPDVLYLGFTVTHTLMQIAVIMGCNPIYLIGVDHRYNLSEKCVQNRKFGGKSAKIWIAEDASKPTHFTDQYTQGEKQKLFVAPSPERSEACFQVAREWTECRGIKIYNATPDTGLDVFEKVDFDTLF